VLTRDDLIDIIVAGLPKGGPAAAVSKGPPKAGPPGRPFLSEYDIKKRLTAGGSRLTIPRSAILSPLATDWLTLKGIEVIRE
jgi:hypothetical protein